MILAAFAVIAAAPAAARAADDESSRRQRTVEAAFLPLPEAQRCESLHRELTAEPHVAGTDGGRRVAEMIARRFREYGLETEIESHEVLLSFPRVVEVEMTAPRRLAALSPLAPGAADRRPPGGPRAMTGPPTAY